MKKLPKLKTPIFTTNLPSSNRKIKYSGFTVKEEKLMLIAKESKEVEDALNAVHQVVNNCIQEANNFTISADDLAMVDITWLLIATRSKSVNDKINLTIKDDETQEEIPFELTLDNTEIIRPESSEDKSKIDIDGTVLILKYPGFKAFKRFIETPDDPNNQFEVLKDSLHKIATEEEVLNFSDFSDEEIEEFIDSMPDYVPEKIREFYDTLPELRHTIHYKRPSDGKEKTFVVQGFDAFFT